jgi:DNA modification methylase
VLNTDRTATAAAQSRAARELVDPGAGAIRNLPALDLLKTVADGAAGAVITDPPFFIGIKRDAGGAGCDPWVGGVVSVFDEMIAWSMPHAVQVARILRPGGASVVMGGSQSISAWEVAAGRAGLVWMAELVILWNTGKPRARKFGSLTTLIRWHAKPGSRHAFNSGGLRAIYSNVLVCDKVPLNERHHIAQKPVELTNFLVSLLTHDGDLIVDPFCGSGSTLVSAAMCERRWLGGDTDIEQCRIAETRIGQLELEEANLRPLHLWINGRLQLVEG